MSIDNFFEDLPDGSIEQMYNEYLEAQEELHLSQWETQMQDLQNENRKLKYELAELKLAYTKLEFKAACGLI